MTYEGAKCTGTDVLVFIAKTRLDKRQSDGDGRNIEVEKITFSRDKLRSQPNLNSGSGQ